MILPNRPQHASDVASHYDELDPVYRALWGEHVHHGLWQNGSESIDEAVTALSDRVAERLGLASLNAPSLVDIGCGYGGTARRFAERHQAHVIGYTLSREQAAHAPFNKNVDIRVGDWLTQHLDKESFDGAYAIESSEHMADKPGFFAQAAALLKPGGRLAICAWLAAEQAGSLAVRHLLEPICREGRLAGMGTRSEYLAMAEAAGLRTLSYEDVSRQVQKTWSICTKRFVRKLRTDPAYIRLVASRRTQNRIFALSLPRLILAYRTGAMRYGIFTFEKPLQATMALGVGRAPAAS